MLENLSKFYIGTLVGAEFILTALLVPSDEGYGNTPTLSAGIPWFTAGVFFGRLLREGPKIPKCLKQHFSCYF